jgi:uncharacterized protein YndB with AHSA1/START domain
MDMGEQEQRVVSAFRAVAAPPAVIFELIADPEQQPRWDGNDNLLSGAPGQRVTAIGDVFSTVLTHDSAVRENHVVEFVEGRLIAWRPAEPGAEPPGHLWRWELEPLGDGLTRVTHTYDWSELRDPTRLSRARSTTSERLLSSVDRLAALAEGAGRGAAQPVGADGLDLVHHLHDQLDWHWRAQARPRLDGLTDAEYLWEPAPGTWNLRRREDQAPATVTSRAGAGSWLLDFALPEPEPAPVTSVAWRLGHVVVGVLGARAHAHFGGPPADYDSWTYAGTAGEALAQLDSVYEAWSTGVRSLSAEALARPVGPAEGPWAEHPMLALVLHINRETIHHLAEVALLRDLWANRDATG